MSKALVLSKEIFRVKWNGKLQQCAVDQMSVQGYINNSLNMGCKPASFTVYSNYCTSYDVAAFLNGELKKANV